VLRSLLAHVQAAAADPVRGEPRLLPMAAWVAEQAELKYGSALPDGALEKGLTLMNLQVFQVARAPSHSIR
jgi:hypothetical protein